MRFSRRLSYGSVGLLLSAGAPVGLLLVRLAADLASPRSLAEEWTQQWLDYVYVALSTAIVFTTFGAVLGWKADQLARLATVDGLTRLLNRRGLAGRLEIEVRRAQRYGQPLSILLIDLDRLKRINDRRGHDAGDHALRRVGDAIRFGCRATDVAGRWGGDEFLVLAPSTPLDEARRLGERIRDSLSAPGGPTALTVSVGIATVSSPAVSPDDLLRQADTALYTAKRRGRNQVAGDDATVGADPASQGTGETGDATARGTVGKAVSSKVTNQ